MLVHICDEESFHTYKNVLDGELYQEILPSEEISTSTSNYGILNETFGWIKNIHLDIISGELQIGFTQEEKFALAIKGFMLKGRIITWGSCITL